MTTMTRTARRSGPAELTTDLDRAPCAGTGWTPAAPRRWRSSGDIHLVRSSGSDLAVSLHVYGADLGRTGTSIRRRYDLSVAWQRRRRPDRAAPSSL